MMRSLMIATAACMTVQSALAHPYAGVALLPDTAAAAVLRVAAKDSPGLVVEHPWARATAGAATTGVIYFTITDNAAPDRLVSVSTPAAAMAGLHETINDNGVMKMRPVAGISLEPGKPVTLKPGGYHVMLMGLKAPLQAGATVPLTLVFEHAPPLTVAVTVEAIGASMPAHEHGDSMGMHDHMEHGQ